MLAAHGTLQVVFLPLVAVSILIPLLQSGLRCFFSCRTKVIQSRWGFPCTLPQRSSRTKDCSSSQQCLSSLNLLGNSWELEQNEKLRVAFHFTSLSWFLSSAVPANLFLQFPLMCLLHFKYKRTQSQPETAKHTWPWRGFYLGSVIGFGVSMNPSEVV